MFSWLSETFDRLKVKEHDWKKEQGFLEESLEEVKAAEREADDSECHQTDAK